MDKLLLWMLILIIFGTFFISDQQTIQQARSTTLKSITYLLPGWCYIGIPGISCEDPRITETGLAITISNHITSFSKATNDLASLTITIPGCQPNNAKEGLLNEETETIVFRNCTLGTAGTHWQTIINITYEEGTLPNTITRIRKGYISGTVTY
ncbi:MAG: hypothetical protein Q7R96_01685 [Nanoarchaeota archaeon]|nr:hypothetical protein [Nanoarchaeota archaeon]